MAKHSKKRVPKLSYTENRRIEFYVAYRDPTTGKPTKHRFGMIEKGNAEALYYQWVSNHLMGKVPAKRKAPVPAPLAT